MSWIGERVAPARLGRDFRWLLGSSLVSNIGDGIALAAGPLLVAAQTRNALLIAAAAVVQRIPTLALGLFAGAIADRLDRRRIVIAANLARAAVLLVLVATILGGAVNIGVVLAALFLLGCAEVFADTTTSTILPMVVGPADLGVGQARLQGSFLTANQLLGPPIGAFLFAAGTAVPFVAHLVTMLLALLLFARIALPPGGVRGGRPETHVRADIADGLRWLWRHPAVRTLALVILLFNITWGAPWGVMVLYALDHLEMGEVGFGLLTTAAAVGGLAGTAAYDWLESHVSLATLMRACLTLEVLTHLALALTTDGTVALVIMVVFGAYAFVWGTLSTAVRQRAVPTAYQGRVGSVYVLGLVGGLLLGQAIGGALAQAFGVLAAFWFAFAGSGLTLLLVWRALGHIAHAGLSEDASTL